ncbi:hypothetical protein [Variovorax ginsengisoli]|uniref:Uncharacterized protein n=1 Tax=Variovorax ginsengisoli TaxID=363844 RepID=A0ABT8SE27_9BURK|nr:hypothetical protein [Variovorax ginsengisoli]MDN8617993.1 hypothetical protein [Variovorax ginsengisoli]MDO1537163.1 hypothetical protein [Variovorax ginsengisoli]
MPSMQLGDFTSRFLTFNKLDGFTLVFEPSRKGRSRRAKRSSAVIDAQIPESGSPVPNTKTVGDLISRFHKLTQETEAWVQGPRSYTAKVYDLRGEPVSNNTSLSDLRSREDARKAKALDKARSILNKALWQCEKELELDEIEEVFNLLLKERA